MGVQQEKTSLKFYVNINKLGKKRTNGTEHDSGSVPDEPASHSMFRTFEDKFLFFVILKQTQIKSDDLSLVQYLRLLEGG